MTLIISFIAAKVKTIFQFVKFVLLFNVYSKACIVGNTFCEQPFCVELRYEDEKSDHIEIVNNDGEFTPGATVRKFRTI